MTHDEQRRAAYGQDQIGQIRQVLDKLDEAIRTTKQMLKANGLDGDAEKIGLVAAEETKKLRSRTEELEADRHVSAIESDGSYVLGEVTIKRSAAMGSQRRRVRRGLDGTLVCEDAWNQGAWVEVTKVVKHHRCSRTTCAATRNGSSYVAVGLGGYMDDSRVLLEL